ncbi:MAG: hypothetical protein K0S61_391 [Anaerocolumna sp.]|jgi:hypothetical protein|nr:hypothetical protein [Anaerocolumna sp.]
MKRKYYLRGIGIGIIFAAIIMLIAYNTSYKDKMSDKEIIERAKELGMVYEEDNSNLDELLLTVTPSPTPTEEAVANDLQPTKEAEETIVPTIAPTKVPDKVPTEGVKVKSDESESSDQNDESKDQQISIEITAGMSSEGVAKLLKSKGVIEDSAAFNQYLILNNYTKEIRIGTYEVVPFTSYKEITDIIIFK